MDTANGGFFENIVKFQNVISTISKIRPMFGTKLTVQLKEIENYNVIKLVAHGTFGMVYKCVEKNTNALMAAKRLTMVDETRTYKHIPSEIYSELKILNMINHENIVFTKDVIVKECGVFVLMEYMEHDLGGIIGSNIKLTDEQKKAIVIQMLRGLQYLHGNNIIHRDIKCNNILMNAKGAVKIGDFGLSKHIKNVKDFKNLTKVVATMAYRPPEIILRDSSYGFPIDIWGIGCILIMMHTRVEPFLGLTEKDVLVRIFDIIGVPDKSNYPAALQLRRFKSLKLGEMKKRNFLEILKKIMNDDEAELTKELLILDPQKRITASDALNCKWLKDFDITQVSPPSIANKECRDKFVRIDLI